MVGLALSSAQAEVRDYIRSFLVLSTADLGPSCPLSIALARSTGELWPLKDQ